MKKTIADELPDIAFLMGVFAKTPDEKQRVLEFKELYKRMLIAVLHDFDGELKAQADKNYFLMNCDSDNDDACVKTYLNSFKSLILFMKLLKKDVKNEAGDSLFWEELLRKNCDYLAEIKARSVRPDFANKTLFIQRLLEVLSQNNEGTVSDQFRLLSILSKMLISLKDHNALIAIKSRKRPAPKKEAVREVLRRYPAATPKEVAKLLEDEESINDFSTGKNGFVEWNCDLGTSSKTMIKWRRFRNSVSEVKKEYKKN